MSDTETPSIAMKLLDELKADPKLRQLVIEEIGEKHFIKRDEFSILLKELKEQRELIAEQNVAAEKRFVAMDKRFEAMDKRFEILTEELRRQIAFSEKRFEAMDIRFEAMDKRFEAVDKRFEILTEELRRQIAFSEKRFEAVDKRFEAVDKRFEVVINRLDDHGMQLREMKAAIGSFTSRTGIAVEETIIEVMRMAIIDAGLSSDNVSSIEKCGIRDTEGHLLDPGSKIQFDGIIRDDDVIILEIKYKPNHGDVFLFVEKAKAFAKYEKVEPVLWLIAVEIQERILDIAERNNIKVVYSRIVR